jgi:hypothetical protein
MARRLEMASLSLRTAAMKVTSWKEICMVMEDISLVTQVESMKVNSNTIDKSEMELWLNQEYGFTKVNSLMDLCMEEVWKTSLMVTDMKVSSKMTNIMERQSGIATKTRPRDRASGQLERDLTGPVSQSHVKFLTMGRSTTEWTTTPKQVNSMLNVESFTKVPNGMKTSSPANILKSIESMKKVL